MIYLLRVFERGKRGLECMELNNDIKYQKKKQLFLDQKKTLDSFLKTGAISRMQYDKSYGDLVKKMGMEKVAEEMDKI